LKLKRADLSGSATAHRKLGVSDWKRSRNWLDRILQSLHRFRRRHGLSHRGDSDFYQPAENFSHEIVKARKKINQLTLQKSGGRTILILTLCLAGMSLALLLTVTRTAAARILISSFAIRC